MGEQVPTLDELTDRGDVIGTSGVRLAVRAAGPVDAPPMVLLHGWAQSSRVWARQLTGPLVESFRMVAADLRGHGDSDAPVDDYDSAWAWAGDVEALLAAVGRPAVLVGWSYGGLVITDYLRCHGTSGVAGLVFVGAITEIGRGRAGGRVGPVLRAALPAAFSADPRVAEPALREFVTGMAALPCPDDFVAELVGESLRVPARVRSALFARDVASADVLARIDVPTLVLHGEQDAVVAPSAGRYAADLIPGATLNWLPAGHLPFVERADDVDGALALHLRRCFAGGAA